MKTFTNSGNIDSYDLVHISGNKDNYTVTENNGELTYVSNDLDKTYIISSVEEFGFKYTNGAGTNFKWEEEFEEFNAIPNFKKALFNSNTDIISAVHSSSVDLNVDNITQQDYTGILTKSVDGYAANDWGLEVYDQKFRFCYTVNDTQTNIYADDLAPKGQDTHLMMVCVNKTMTMFINGIAQSSVLSYSSSVSNSIRIDIGNRNGYGKLRGSISDIQMYKNVVITNSDVLDIMNGKLKDGLTAHWDFEGANPLDDKSTNSNTLTMSGATIVDN